MRRREIKIILAFCFMLMHTALIAQIGTNLSHYKQNKFLYNPACAGAEGYTAFNLTAKEQWVGFDQAPSTQAFSVETRLLKRGYKIFKPIKAIFGGNSGSGSKFKIFSSQTRGKIGLGAFVFHDQIGLINNTGMQLAYSYHTFIQTTQISLGLGLSVSQFRLNEGKMIINDQLDPLINETKNRMLLPDASMGAYVHNRLIYAGLSINNLFKSAIKIGNESGISYNEPREFNFIGGLDLPINDDFVFEPSALVNIEKDLNYGDITLAASYQNRFEAGLTYRSSGEIIILTGVYIKEIYIGYAFDYPFNNVGKYSIGSHEIMLSYRIGSGERRSRYQNRF